MKKYYMIIRKSTAKPVVIFDKKGEADGYANFTITTLSKKEAVSVQKELSDLYQDEEYVLKSFYL